MTHPGSQAITRRAAEMARARNQNWCGPGHVLLALLTGPSTPARDAMGSVGLTVDIAERALAPYFEERSDEPIDSVRWNPAMHTVMGMAVGIAIGMDNEEPADFHILLGLIHGSSVVDDALRGLDATEEDILAALRRSGHRTPAASAPSRVRSEPASQLVYYPASDQSAVTEAMLERWPPGTERWGWNVSLWRPGFHWLAAPPVCDAEYLIRGAARDPERVEAIDAHTAEVAEAAARRAGPTA